MEIQPASVQQVLAAGDGHWVDIDPVAGSVAKDLRNLDRSLHVRLSERGGIWVVFQRVEENGRTIEHLVTTCQAHKNSFGVWEGLDQRIVERVRKIMRPEYDYAGEVERLNRAARRKEQRERRERIEGHAEKLAWAARRDLGGRKHF